MKETPFDLLLTGVQAGDDGYGQVGSILAELFNLPHACMVNQLDVQVTKLPVHRELEGGLEEACEIELPALLSIQTRLFSRWMITALWMTFSIFFRCWQQSRSLFSLYCDYG